VSLAGAFIVAMRFSSAIIRPEQNGPRNWTMVSAVPSYRLQCPHAKVTQTPFFPLKIDRSEGNFVLHA
jgi:hypothetical protein